MIINISTLTILCLGITLARSAHSEILAKRTVNLEPSGIYRANGSQVVAFWFKVYCLLGKFSLCADRVTGILEEHFQLYT
jgi:hypothetical protein